MYPDFNYILLSRTRTDTQGHLEDMLRDIGQAREMLEGQNAFLKVGPLLPIRKKEVGPVLVCNMYAVAHTITYLFKFGRNNAFDL